jgi:hypothetical protein
MPDWGRIATDPRADLILANGDPNTDITATRNMGRIGLAGFLADLGALLRKMLFGPDQNRLLFAAQ